MKKTTKWKWKCTNCNKETVSTSDNKNEMDWCKCGKVGVDIEKGYARVAAEKKEYFKMIDENYEEGKDAKGNDGHKTK